ncbi:hypothetical protein [Micromonospora chokoriensis]|uniref:hypothetical protein n=1 Tax=Micromonospora chokoriensis TaxID=356851 RepID=UPI000A6F481E|nr:hypothetical protein [Micromonospora chokoriensis]
MRLRSRRKSLAVPLLTATAVCAAGFGALATMWATGRWRDRPGLFDYESATWGDALLLPIGTALLTGAVRALPGSGSDRRWFWLAFTAGAAAGTAVQASWLRDPNPATNWTLPQPHTFNLPGWYHAAFFVLLGGATCGLWVLLVRRLSADAASAVQRRRAFAAAVAAAASFAAFAVLVVRDNATTSATSAGRATLVGLAVAAVAVLGPAIVMTVRHRDA